MEQSENGDFIAGRNPILEALRSDRAVDTLFVAGGERSPAVARIIAMAKERGAVIKEVTSSKLDSMWPSGSHQGVILTCAAQAYVSVQDILSIAEAKGQPPFIVICDEITDPHNLGAIIRTAEALGVHGVIIPKRRSVGLSAVVAKVSAGAVAFMPVARVGNLAGTIAELKEKGIWIYGAHTEGTSYKSQKYDGGKALVIGSEGAGISRLIKESCDFLVTIPMRGKVGSLNASVAAGIILSEMMNSLP